MRLGSPLLLSESTHRVRGLRTGSIFWTLLGIPRSGVENALAQQLGPVSTGDSESARHRESPRPVAVVPSSLSSVFCGSRV